MRKEFEKHIAAIWAESTGTADDKKAIPPRILATRKTVIEVLQDLQRHDDIVESLTGERCIIEAELVDHGNSAIMIKSLNNAMDELDAALRMVERVRKPEEYRITNEDADLEKNRIGDLPNDQARQFFRAQFARLKNIDKSRLSDSEKEVLKARRDNLRVAELHYIGLQEKALAQI